MHQRVLDVPVEGGDHARKPDDLRPGADNGHYPHSHIRIGQGSEKSAIPQKMEKSVSLLLFSSQFSSRAIALEDIHNPVKEQLSSFAGEFAVWVRIIRGS